MTSSGWDMRDIHEIVWESLEQSTLDPDPAVAPISRCGHCPVCVTAPRPLPPVPVRKARSWWPYAAAAAVGSAAVWRWQR